MKRHVSTNPTERLETSDHPESLRDSKGRRPGGTLQPTDGAVVEYRYRAESRASSIAHLAASSHLK